MSDAPYGGHPPAPAPWPQQESPPAGKQSRWPLLLTAIIALIAIGVAIASWFRPVQTVEAAPDQPRYSEQEVSDAKKAVCEAYNTSYAAIEAAGDKSDTDDPTWRLAAAVNTRLAFHAVGDRLDSALSQNLAAPEGLVDEIRKAASAYHDATLALIANMPADSMDAISKRMDVAHAEVRKLCT